jgi:hypothetical protein
VNGTKRKLDRLDITRDGGRDRGIVCGRHNRGWFG